MNKINWKQKLSSRKFITALLGFTVPLLLSFGISESVTTQWTSVIMAGFTLVSYILGESMVDSGRNNIDESTMGQVMDQEESEE